MVTLFHAPNIYFTYPFYSGTHLAVNLTEQESAGYSSDFHFGRSESPIPWAQYVAIIFVNDGKPQVTH